MAKIVVDKKLGVAMVPLFTKEDEQCPVAGSIFCVQICPFWPFCESESSPWRKNEHENLSDDDTTE